ncbi:MAG: tRNA (adenosine(37)-N6)-threonylcarbamoyltransferase complex dimerization subunit type 1 TsaB [Eubacteriales Family XIII. Incertae Sedis bacterium]|nr:MAG: tRNA (adenosine(37)-N6)-threonylcarbamoyltransferase complex dimerization subunit type 1 TsaB [Clostridiales Family XIII bacterium]
MYILAIETTGPHCSAAIIDGAGNVTEKSSDGTMNHLQNLLPMVRALLTDCKLQIDDASAVAVSCGPGSFTGIRIGVATARALCQATGKPGIAVPTLESFVYHENFGVCGEQGAASDAAAANCVSAGGKIVVPIFDARRSQVYGGAYEVPGLEVSGRIACSDSLGDVRNGKIMEVVRGGAYMLDEFLQRLAESLCGSAECKERFEAAKACGRAEKEIVFYGDGCEKYGDTALEFCKKRGLKASICGETQKASSVAKLALEMYKAGELLEYGQIHPNYMRKAEAERKLEEKMGMQVK